MNRLIEFGEFKLHQTVCIEYTKSKVKTKKSLSFLVVSGLLSGPSSGPKRLALGKKRPVPNLQWLRKHSYIYLIVYTHEHDLENLRNIWMT